MVYNREFHQLVSGCTETKLQFWDAETGKQLNQIDAPHGEYGELTAMAIDPTGYRLATGASDGSIKIWDFGSGQELKVSRGRLHVDNCGIVGLFFCQVDGNRCLTAVGRGNHVMLFSVGAILLFCFIPVHWTKIRFRFSQKSCNFFDLLKHYFSWSFRSDVSVRREQL